MYLNRLYEKLRLRLELLKKEFKEYYKKDFKSIFKIPAKHNLERGFNSIENARKDYIGLDEPDFLSK